MRLLFSVIQEYDIRMASHFKKHFFVLIFSYTLGHTSKIEAKIFHKKDNQSRETADNSPKVINLFKASFTPKSVKDRPQTRASTKFDEREKEDKGVEVPGNFKQRNFLKSVLSYDVKYKYGYEGSGGYMDCSYFVQHVLESKRCIDIPFRLNSDSNMRETFGEGKKCAPGDIVVTSGHMGFYWGPGLFVGNNSGQGGVGVHGSSGRCYPNPCL